MRKIRSFMWVSPDDCEPPHGLDMTLERNYSKVEYLRNEFVKNGFDLNKSALVGYPLKGRIQLLSGTHRHLAAKQAGILLPVTMWIRSDVERTWGTEMWEKTIKDISVNDLTNFMVEDGFQIPSHEPINIENLHDTE